uniref:Uncharacterized protein n=2 Tax=Cacopsylla melanoneura TaxID=428564 RepID=A0A8D8YQA2_9HEMI
MTVGTLKITIEILKIQTEVIKTYGYQLRKGRTNTKHKKKNYETIPIQTLGIRSTQMKTSKPLTAIALEKKMRSPKDSIRQERSTERSERTGYNNEVQESVQHSVTKMKFYV